MKVKNLFVDCFNINGVEKLVVVKDKSKLGKMMCELTGESQNDLKCVFTKTQYYDLNRKKIIPLALCRDIEELNENITKKELKEYIVKNEEDIKRLVLGKNKLKGKRVGFVDINK